MKETNLHLSVTINRHVPNDDKDNTANTVTKLIVCDVKVN